MNTLGFSRIRFMHTAEILSILEDILIYFLDIGPDEQTHGRTHGRTHGWTHQLKYYLFKRTHGARTDAHTDAHTKIIWLLHPFLYILRGTQLKCIPRAYLELPSCERLVKLTRRFWQANPITYTDIVQIQIKYRKKERNHTVIILPDILRDKNWCRIRHRWWLFLEISGNLFYF